MFKGVEGELGVQLRGLFKLRTGLSKVGIMINHF